MRPIALAAGLAPVLCAASNAPAYRDELLSLHKQLIDISSTSGHENEVGDWLAGYLNKKGYNTHKIKSGGDRFDVIALKTDQITKPKLLVSSHIDVVPPHIPYEIDDGEITKDTMIKGRGSVDAKGSVASIITAVEELLKKESIQEEDVFLAFVVGEEVMGDGMRTFSDFTERNSLKFSSAIFGEPTEGKLACGHKGGLACSITANGKAGHSGYPWLSKSANEVMIKGLAKVLDTDLGSSEEYGNTTVNVGKFEGGVASNVIPEKAKVDMMVRVAIGPEKGGADIIEKKIRGILKEIDDEAFDIDCSPGYGFVAAECEVDGFDSIVVNYGTDIPHLKGDHKRYLYGPGSILVAHGANENITVGALEAAVEDYQKLILHALENKDEKSTLEL